MDAYGPRGSDTEHETTGTRSQQTGGGQYGGSRSTSSQDPQGGQIKSAAKHAARQAKETAGKAVNDVRERAASALDQQRAAASDRLDHVANAIHHTASELDDDPTIAGLAHRAADGVHQISGYLREHDLRDVVDQVEGFARRHPVWFLGGLFVAGMLTARLLKGAAPDDGDSDDDLGDYEYRGTSYGSQGLATSTGQAMSEMTNEGGRWEAP